MFNRILITFGALVAALALSTSPALADTAAFEGQVTQVGATNSEAQATCNYRVWAAEGVNLHIDKDRSSRVMGHRAQGYVFYGVPCNSSEGGRYGSCGTGFEWKSVGRYWVASKCLTKV